MSRNEIYKNKEWLEKRYSEVGTSTIAKECEVDDAVIGYFLRKYDIKVRTRSESLKSTQNRKYHVDENYFKNIDTAEKAYWLGFLMADGCMRNYSNNNLLISLELSVADKDHLDKFLSAIQYTGESQIGKRYDNKGVDRVRFNLANGILCNDLYAHGIIPHKTGNESFPNSTPDSFKKDFIRGFFDGDGSIIISNSGRYRARFHLVSQSYTILKEIMNILSENNIDFPKKALHLKSGSKDIWELETSSFPNVNNIFKYLYYDNCVCLKRKFNKFRDFNDFYINHSRNSKNKNFKKDSERYSPNI